MRESIDSIYKIIENDNYQACLEDKEYEHKVSGKIVEMKGLFGFKETRLDESDPEREYRRLDSCINEFVQFCKQYDLPYEVSESVEYGGEQNNFTGGRGKTGRFKHITREVDFTVTSDVAQKLMHELFAKRTDSTVKYFIGRSAGWYDRLKNSEAVRAVANEIISYVEKNIEGLSAGDKIGGIFEYKCERSGVVIDNVYHNNKAVIGYEELGFEDLGSDEQTAAVTAAVIPLIMEVFKSDPDIFDLYFSQSAIYNNYNASHICIQIAEKENRDKKKLKSW